MDFRRPSEPLGRSAVRVLYRRPGGVEIAGFGMPFLQRGRHGAIMVASVGVRTYNAEVLLHS